MTDFRRLLQTFERAKVRFIVIGGVAAVAHGTARLTTDLDIVYAREADNVRRLVGALAPHKPYLRGAPPGLPFRFDEKTIAMGLNFTLRTDLGDVDLLGEIVGGGRFEDLAAHSTQLSLYGIECFCLSIPALIRAKRAAGRPKDLEAIAELEALLAEKERST
jgi:hypothetical protein